MKAIESGESTHLPAATGLVAAALAASCCLLPLTLIATGVVGAGVMMTMMQYEWLTLPLGVLALACAYGLHLRERRRCDRLGCRLAEARATQVTLAVATSVVGSALLLKAFPSWTTSILQWFLGT